MTQPGDSLPPATNILEVNSTIPGDRKYPFPGTEQAGQATQTSEEPWPFPAETEEERQNRINALNEFPDKLAAKPGDDVADGLFKIFGFQVLDADGQKMMFGDKVRDAHSDFSGTLMEVIHLDTGMARIVVKSQDGNEEMTVDANMCFFVSRPQRTVMGTMEEAIFNFGDKIKDSYANVAGFVTQKHWPVSGCVTYMCKRKVKKKEIGNIKSLNPFVFVPQRHAVLVREADSVEDVVPPELLASGRPVKTTKSKEIDVEKPAKIPGPPSFRTKISQKQVRFY